MDHLSAACLRNLQPPTIKDACDYANESAYLPDSDSHAGKWVCRKYQEEMLRCMSAGTKLKANGAPINTVILVKSAQIGYTQMLLNSIAYHIKHRPSNLGMYFQTDDAAKQFAGNQLARYIEAQPSLQGVVSSEVSSDGKSSSTRKTFQGGSFRMFAASKGSDVATVSLQCCFLDEVDLYKDVRGEGDPIALISNRLTEYVDSLLVVGSTPRGTYSESRVWQQYVGSDMRRFFIACPKCGKPQYLSSKNFVIGQSDYNESGFRCVNETCNYVMTEGDKYKMLREGYWRPTAREGDLKIGGRAGFHIWAAYSESPKVSWPNLARQKVDAGQDKQAIISFINTKYGLPSADIDKYKTKPDNILEKIPPNSYQVGEIPNDVCLLTAGVDVQSSIKDGRLEFSLWGWSRDHAYFIRHLSVSGNISENEVWETLKEVLCQNYKTIDGKKNLKVARVFVDSGDGASTLKVYERCKTYARLGFAPIKGQSYAGKSMIVESKVAKSWQTLYSIQVSTAKDVISDLLQDFVSGNPECALRLPVDIEPLVVEGWCSEYRQVRQGNPPRVIWTYDKKTVRNESLDCWVYALAAKEHRVSRYDSDTIWPQLERSCLKTKAKRTNSRYGKGNTSAVSFDGFF